MLLNIGLDNKELYAGCEIEEVGGRLTLTTPVADAINIIGRNATATIDKLNNDMRSEITLTGATAIWVYLVVFHIVVHKFGKVYYDDGRSGAVLIAQH